MRGALPSKSGAGRNNSMFPTLMSKVHGGTVKVALVKERKLVPNADEYRRLADECLELSPRISPDLRAHFVALSQGWAKLADALEEDHSVLPDQPPIYDHQDLPRDPDDNGKDRFE
jgi:hypothetical protein